MLLSCHFKCILAILSGLNNNNKKILQTNNGYNYVKRFLYEKMIQNMEYKQYLKNEKLYSSIK